MNSPGVEDTGVDAGVGGYPSLAFDSLFENRGSLRNLSVLDRVKEPGDVKAANERFGG